MPKTILIIEDNYDDRLDIENFLKFNDFRTVSVENIESALGLIQSVEIDIILMSFCSNNSPYNDFIYKTRSNNNYIPIIIIIPSEFSDTSSQLTDIDADDYITKPLSKDILKEKIMLVLRIGILEKQVRSNANALEKKVFEHGRKILRTRSEAKQVSAINDIINIINSDININGVVIAISREIRKLISFDKLSIILKHPYDEHLILYTQNEINPDEIITKNIYLSATNGPGRVFNTRQIIINSDIHKDQNIFLEFEQILSGDIHSAVIFPLISKGKLIGTFNIGNKIQRYYKKSDIKIISKVINQIAVVIENARLYSEVKDLSHQLQKTVEERNLEIERKYYQLSLLNKVGQSMQGTEDLDKLLHLILTCVTAGGALGFNRAVLLRANYENESLEGVIGVGPSSWEEAWQIWDRLSKENWTIDDFLKHCDRFPMQTTYLDNIARELKISLNNKTDLIVMSVIEKRPFLITDVMAERRINQFIKDKLIADELVIVPLIARDKALGVIIADNLFSGKKIEASSMQSLIMFANQAGLAIERAVANEKLNIKINELKKAYEELKETQSKLMRTERLATIGKMAAHVAHEIRNPLATIGGFAHTMSKYPHDKDRISRNSGIICDEVYRLERILQNVLDFTKPALPVFELSNLNKVVDDTIIILEKDILSNNINFKKILNTDIPNVLLDSQQIKQALINIMKNAIYSIAEQQYENDTDKLLEISTDIDTERELIKVSVLDTGKGMVPHVIDNLFNPFFSTKQGGSGLGLAVTHKIIEDHGGYIDVKSQVGKGSEFVINLPMRTENIN